MKLPILHLTLTIPAQIGRLITRDCAKDEPRGYRNYVLGTILYHGGTCSFSDIVSNLPVDKGTISRQLQWLEEHQYLTRTLAEGSARRKCASLLPRGRQYTERIFSRLQEGDAFIRQEFYAVEYKRLLTYVKRLHQNLTAIRADSSEIPAFWPQLFYYLFHSSMALNRHLNDARTALGLLLPEQRIIMGLAHVGGWVDYKTFEREFIISQQEVAKTFLCLKQQGLVELRTKENDRRAKEALLTGAGYQMNERLHELHSSWNSDAFKHLSGPGLDQFYKLLVRLQGLLPRAYE